MSFQTVHYRLSDGSAACRSQTSASRSPRPRRVRCGYCLMQIRTGIHGVKAQRALMEASDGE